MGADFCLEWLSIEKLREPDWKKAERELSRLEGTHISGWPGEYVERRLGKVPAPGEPDMNYRTEEVEKLKEALGDIRMAWASNFRDSVKIDICHRTVLCSGGMSWGDPPTDTCERIGLLWRSGLARAAGFE